MIKGTGPVAGFVRYFFEADKGCCQGGYYGVEGEYSVVSATGSLTQAGVLSMGEYGRWLSGVDPRHGVKRGRQALTDRSVRFYEFSVNGPKSLNIAAWLHPELRVVRRSSDFSAPVRAANCLGRSAPAWRGVSAVNCEAVHVTVGRRSSPVSWCPASRRRRTGRCRR